MKWLVLADCVVHNRKGFADAAQVIFLPRGPVLKRGAFEMFAQADSTQGKRRAGVRVRL